MNLKDIKIIINSNMDDNLKEMSILSILSKDKNVIPNILKILDYERELKNEMISDLRSVLCLSHLSLDDKKLSKQANPQEKIINLFRKYKGELSHQFPIYDEVINNGEYDDNIIL